ncbi:MAG TPA: Crp/Fnr family transcriptional regulator [Terriglobales bacterium]
MATATFSPSLLANLGPVDLEKILAMATVRPIAKKQIIVNRGEVAEYLFILREGRIRYYMTTKRGEEIVFRWITPGDCFGLGTILEKPVPYMGTAEVLTPGEVLAWPQAKVRTIVSLYPQVAENALRVVLQYLGNYADRHSRLLTESAEERVVDVLLTLGHQQGRIHDGHVELDITNEQLSALADVSLFTTSRLMSKWASEGSVSKSRGRVLVHAPEALVAS